jgi:SAM-dependent methyltransferase
MGNDAQRRAAFTYNAAADFYDASPLGFWNYFGRRTVERLSLQSGSRVLDACCGAGASALSAAEIIGLKGKVIGVDLAQGLLELAQGKQRNAVLATRSSSGAICSLSGSQMKASMPQYACSEFSSFPIWPRRCRNFGVAYDPAASWL